MLPLRTLKIGVLLPAVTVCALFIIAFYILWMVTPHFEDHFAMYKMFIYETNTGLTFNFHYMNDIMGWETLLGKIQKALPSISWWSVAVLASVIFPVAMLMGMLGRTAVRSQFPISVWVMLCMFVFIFFIWNIFWVHHNRAAFSLAALGVLGGILQPFKKNPVHGLIRMGWTLVFTAGICWRFEAGIVAFLLLSPLCLLSEELPIKLLLYKILLPALVVTGFIGVYIVKTNIQPDFYYTIEPEVEYELMNRRNIAPISTMQTAKDSMRYRAVNEHWMLGDIQQTNALFIRSLIPKPEGFIHRFFFFLKGSNRPAPEAPVTEMVFTYGILLLNFAVLLWLLWLQKRKRAMLFMLGYVAFAILLLSLSFRVDQLQRVTQPFLLLLSIAMFAIAVMRYRAVNARALWWTAAAVSILNIYLLVNELSLMRHYSVSLLQTEKNMRAQIAGHIDASERRFVLPLMDFSIFNTGVFTPYNGFKGKRLLFYEFGQFSATPPLLQTIRNITACPGDDFKCRLEYLQQNRSDFIIISTPQRLAFMEEYARVMYGVELNMQLAQKVCLNDNVYLWFP